VPEARDNDLSVDCRVNSAGKAATGARLAAASRGRRGTAGRPGTAGKAGAVWAWRLGGASGLLAEGLPRDGSRWHPSAAGKAPQKVTPDARLLKSGRKGQECAGHQEAATAP
jgi:hypothetical protein